MAERKDSVLVTGAAGFIGGHAVRTLAAGPWPGEVIALVRRGTSAARLEPLEQAGATVCEVDITEREAVAETFRRHRPGRVLHLAAVRGSGRGSARDYEQINVEATVTLLEAASRHGTERFVYCSSVGVHGTIPADQPAGPRAPLNGDSEYHRSKIRAESAVDRYHRQGLDTCTVRPTITYGPGDDGFPATLVRLVRSRRLPAPDPRVMVHLLDVEALCRLFSILLEAGHPGGRKIIAADRGPVPLLELVDEIYRRHCGRTYPRFPALPRGAARLLSLFLGIVGADAWRTRVRLISESWRYRPGAEDGGPDFAAPDTLATFPESMCR